MLYKFTDNDAVIHRRRMGLIDGTDTIPIKDSDKVDLVILLGNGNKFIKTYPNIAEAEAEAESVDNLIASAKRNKPQYNPRSYHKPYSKPYYRQGYHQNRESRPNPTNQTPR